MPQIVDTEKIQAELLDEVDSVKSQLKKLESQIFEFEGSYLRETLAYGNAVKGWSSEGFKKAETDQAANKKTEVKPNARDRIFSSSSATTEHLFNSSPKS
ncbi:Oidioi.mRNA.OKI2018_I69.chr2.g6295.t1.cds [Oikopleura dioica]|uniref:Chromatin modification-related protein MEAF6 n=1 Tax=Oikopleura dioica TaxID=34765 RepID=A0ABN7T8N0_OIKDI|nr:Oidioi.mRNA.OKI2018_I69.chr2.g6295.t1.cds [Oikopleura dioica]